MKTVTQAEYNALEKFFTQPGEVAPSLVRIAVRAPSVSTNDVPFSTVTLDGGYTFYVSRNGGHVKDGEKVIASMARMANLVVDRAYWGKNLGTQMVVAWFNANAWWKPGKGVLRTPHGKATYIKAWNLIQPTLTVQSE